VDEQSLFLWKSQAAMRLTGNLPPLPGIFPDAWRQ
jgi:hypothetical protein